MNDDDLWYEEQPAKPKTYIYAHESPNAFQCNWCSADDILNNVHLFTEHQRHLFELLQTKRERFADKFKKGNYFTNAFALVAANSRYAERVVCCGNKNRWNGTGSCQKWKLCSRCAFARKHNALKAYLSSFRPNQFVASTISFEGALTPPDWPQFMWVLCYWDAINEAIRDEYDNGNILGAYFIEELALVGFLPLRVLPHVHCIFHVQSADAATVDALRTNLYDGILRSAEIHGWDFELVPSIAMRTITSEKEFANMLQYGLKAIKIAESYEYALALNDHEPEPVEQINHELKRFFSDWLGTTSRRLSIRRLGTMHHGSKHFVGNRWGRKRRREFVEGYMAERKRERKAKGVAE